MDPRTLHDLDRALDRLEAAFTKEHGMPDLRPCYCDGCGLEIPINTYCCVVELCATRATADDSIGPFTLDHGPVISPTFCIDCMGEVGKTLVGRHERQRARDEYADK